jgi:large subunit ribosomal protein L3
MTHLYYIEDHPRSPNFGKEVNHSATVIETPPIFACGLRVYTQTDYGLKTFAEAWTKNPPPDLQRILTLPDSFETEKSLEKIEKNLDKITELRLLTITQPRLTSVPKKKPDLLEIKVDGGSQTEIFGYAKELIGRTITLNEVFKEGQYVDVVAITKGKGFQGPVKRWGVKILPRKSRKTKRGVAVIGPWKPPRVLYTVPRAGQMGYHQRTEYNKRILKIGLDGKEVTPKGGFVKYGEVNAPFVLLDGSIPGPKKRLIRLRHPAREPVRTSEEPLNLIHLSLESQQGT